MMSVSAAAAALKTQQFAPAHIHLDVLYRLTDEKSLHLNIFQSQASQDNRAPVLLHFHGGGWMRGRPPRSWRGFAPFLEAGFSVVTVEYRLGGDAQAPAAVQDARCAVKWVADRSETYGFDRQKMVLMGTSSGAHLALMAAVLPRENEIDEPDCSGAPTVAAVVDFYAPVDLTVRHPVTGKRPRSFARWTGEGDTGLNMARLMSPMNWLTSNSPPVFIVHGGADPVIPIAHSQRLSKRLDQLGVPNQLHIIEGGKHGKFTAAERVSAAHKALRFLKQQGILE